MAKKKLQAAAAEEEEEVAAEATPMKKKRNKQQLVEAADGEVEALTEAMPAKKKRNKKQETDLAEDQGEAPSEATAAGAKKKRKVEAEAVAEAAPASAKKKKKKAAEDPAEAEEAEAEEELPKKAKKKNKASEAAAAEDEKESEQVDTSAKKQKKDKKAKEAALEGEEESEKAAGNGDGGSHEVFTVFVGGIPWSVTEDTLRKDFGECGEVTDANLLTNRETGLSRGIAFITFATEAALKAALKYDGDDYGGRTLKVTRAESRDAPGGKAAGGKGGKGPGSALEIFVKNIHSHTEEPELRAHFAKCGDIAELSLPTRASGKCKGFAWVTFKSQEGFDKALALNGEELMAFKLEIEKAGQHKAGDGKGKGGKGKGKGKGKDKGKNSEFEVFVQNLTYEVTEEALRKLFKDCGEIDRMHMPTKVAGKCMGFAWITFRTKEGMKCALDKHYEEFEGRSLKVEKSGQHRSNDEGGDAKEGGGAKEE